MTHNDLNGYKTVPMIFPFLLNSGHEIFPMSSEICFQMCFFLHCPLVQICSILRTNGTFSFSLSTLYGHQNYAVCLSVFINCLYFGILLYIIASQRTVALWKKYFDCPESYSATHSKNNVSLLRRKSCAWFELNYSILSLCQGKIQDEKSTRYVHLLGTNINKPLDHFHYSPYPNHY